MDSQLREQCERPGTQPTDAPSENAKRAPGEEVNKDQQTIAKLRQLVEELREYVAYYLAARSDSARATIRKLGVYAVAGVVGLVALCILASTAVVLLLCGVAFGLGRLFGDRPWLGLVVVGSAVLLALTAAAYWGSGKISSWSQAKTIRKYEQRKQWQDRHFGRNVQDTAQGR